jgi:site-specific recombinase XerC
VIDDRPSVSDLGGVIDDFLAGAEAGNVRAAGGKAYTRAELRELRGALTHVSSELGELDVAEVRSRDVRRLGEELEAAGLPPARVAAILDALRAVYAYAMRRGLVATSPLVGLTVPAPEGPSPTTAMIQFGEELATWAVRLMLVAFLAVAVGLAVALV